MTFSELIAVYLFLGGAAAGAYVVQATLDICNGVAQRKGRSDYRAPGFLCESTYRRVRRIVYGASLVIIAAGVVCLIADLGRPEAFYYLLIYPTGSLVSIGALALSLLFASLVASFCDAAFTMGQCARRALQVIKVMGIPVAVVVMAYTGMLLKSVMAVKLWQSMWLPALFVASALSCGCAIVLLGMCACEDRRATRRWEAGLLRADMVVIVLEVVAAVFLLGDIAGASGLSAVWSILAGAQSLLFWVGFVGCALLLPLAVESAVNITRSRATVAATASVSTLVLVGGLCLRLVMVAAGVQPVV